MFDQSRRATSSVCSMVVLSEWDGPVVVEQAAVKPFDALEPNRPSRLHGHEELSGVGFEFRGFVKACLQHALEHVIGQQFHVLGEHAEDEAVHEVRDFSRLVPSLAQTLRELGEPLGDIFGQLLAKSYQA